MPPGNGKGSGGGGGSGTVFAITGYDGDLLNGTIPAGWTGSIHIFVTGPTGQQTEYVIDRHDGTESWSYDLPDLSAGDYTVTAAYDPHPKNGKFRSTTESTFTVEGASNGAPVAVDDGGTGFATDEDTATFDTGSVLTNDSDPDGDTLVIAGYDGTSTGGASVAHLDNGVFTYTTNDAFEWLGAGETYDDTFDYTVSDGNGGFATATVTVTVTGVNDGPDAADDSGAGFATASDAAFTTGSVLANDTDPDTSDTLTVLPGSLDTTGTLGTVTDNGDGTFSYDPNGAFDDLAPGATATDSFEYTVSDGKGGTDTATVTVEITGAEAPGEPQLLTSYTSGTPDTASTDYFNVHIDFRGTDWSTELQADFLTAADFLSSTIQTGFGDEVLTWSYDGFMMIDDLSIKAELKYIDGTGKILGQAGYYTLHPNSGLPTSGLMQFDTIDAQGLLDRNLWDEVVLHEMLHVAGIGSVWESKGLLAEDADSPTGLVFTGAAATAEYIAMFTEAELLSHGWGSVDAITGVPVEEDGGQGTAGGHWDEQIFGDELMTGYLNGAGTLTDLSIASLADIGYDVSGYGDELLV